MSAPRILQFGTIGQLGRELIDAARSRGIGLDARSLEEADFTRPDDIAKIVRQADCDIVVNATAYTAVDKAESEEALAHTINADTVGVLARACAERGLPLIHVSTDYVFDGAKRSPYLESDVTGPINAYGRTKLAGEQAVRDGLRAHVIIRSSWIFSAHGANFVKTMLRLGAERDALNVVDDQLGCPTAAADLADAILEIVRQIRAGASPDHFGVFHYAGSGETSWRGFAQAIMDGARDWAGTRAQIRPIATADYPTPARRPLYSVLDCTKIQNRYGIKPVPWGLALQKMLRQLQSQRETPGP
jgi:dTDP-4-dehydrorhamnose reductase